MVYLMDRPFELLESREDAGAILRRLPHWLRTGSTDGTPNLI